MKNTQPPTEVNQSHQISSHADSTAPLEDNFPPERTNPIAVLVGDWQAIYRFDPAARNWLEVLFCYPGLQALWCYRVAHWLHTMQIPFFPRFLSHLSRLLTGIEIHPAARIGKGVFIDHGMGVVIGETTEIGNYTLIYQGATLGGTGKEQGKRHPTLGSYVIVGAGAKVLGNIQIGSHVRIGAGSVVLRDVPSDCTVVGVPGRITRRNGIKDGDLEHSHLRDPEAEVIRALFDRIKTLERQVEQLQTQVSDSVQTSFAPSAHTPSETDLVIKEFLDGAGI